MNYSLLHTVIVANSKKVCFNEKGRRDLPFVKTKQTFEKRRDVRANAV